MDVTMIGIGIMMGFAVLGGAIGQGLAARAALEGIARNPGAAGALNAPMMVSLSLIESLVILSFVIAMMTING